MKKIFKRLIVLILFISAAWCLFTAATEVFPSFFFNITLFIVGLSAMSIAAEHVDMINGFGKYSGATTTEKTEIKNEEEKETQKEKIDDNCSHDLERKHKKFKFKK